eukprot:jgi/Mesen1/8348/ME000463S07800
MGLFKSLFSFAVGTTFGVYVAQTYNLPPLQQLVDAGLAYGKKLEELYRKPDEPEGKPDVSGRN